MKVGWLVDDPGYIGGAELTQAEFRAATPDGVEIVDCPKGEVVPGLDRYVCHNVVRYEPEDFRTMGSAPIWKFVHDLWPWGETGREWLCDRARLIFCSPLHRDRFPYSYRYEAAICPPALDLDRYESNGQKREGTCAVAAWRCTEKGGQLLREWSDEHGPVDVYGDGPFVPHGPRLEVKGPLEPDRVADTLSRYERFVFLPTGLEPFCRSVVEAWASGCKLTVNGLIGALYWIQEEPDKLESAGSDFWSLVLDDAAG